MEIKPLNTISFDALFNAHAKAFKDYPFQWSKEALRKTALRRGFDTSLSFGAFHENELVSFTMNGIGIFNNVKTAYDTGTGTIEEYRGKGLASNIFEHSIPFLKAAKVQQYILEVLEENKKAYSVYSQQGFVVSRTFGCFRVNMNEWNYLSPAPVKDITLKEIDLGYQQQMETMTDFNLSWQNNFQALLKKPDDFKVIGAFNNNTFIGYGIIEPETGDIPILAVAHQERRKGTGTLILQELKKMNRADIVKIINIESTQDHIKHFIGKNEVPKIVSQFEMIKGL